MPRTQIALTLAASLLAVAPLAVCAQSASSADKTFVKTAMETDLAEIQLGQLALQKSTNAQVRQFAQKMIDDHTKLDNQVKPIAQQLNVTPPTEPSMKDRALKMKLEHESGASFDKAYIDAMVSGHQSADGDFKKEESGGQDPKVKQAAQQGEPTVAEHLHMAQQLQSSLK